MGEEFRQQEIKAPFNMAISTLEAIRSILADIKKVEMDPLLNEGTKQKQIVNLVKRFYIDSSPLLPSNVVEQYKDILDLKPNEPKVVKDGKTTTRTKVVFDYALEAKLNNYLLLLQRELQKEKYFMPPKKDLGRVVGSFD